MLNARAVSEYFISKDNKKIFNVVSLNNYLFLAQVVYLAKYDKKLFLDDFCAYDSGPAIIRILVLLSKIFFSLENATCEELIEITHKDLEWKSLSKDTYNAPVMDLKNI